MKKLLIALALLICLAFPMSGSCLGPLVFKHMATWDANTETDLAYYCLYWKTVGGVFSDINSVVVAKSATPTFDLLTLNLPAGVYVIAVSAYDAEGNESALSNEAIWDASYPDAPKNTQIK